MANPIPLITTAWRNFWFRFGTIWFVVGLPFLLIAIARVINGRIDVLVGIFGFMGALFSGFGGVILARALRQASSQVQRPTRSPSSRL